MTNVVFWGLYVVWFFTSLRFIRPHTDEPEYGYVIWVLLYYGMSATAGYYLLSLVK